MYYKYIAYQAETAVRVFLYLTYILYYIFVQKSKIQTHKMAERMGFEPMHGYSPPSALAKRPLKPAWVPLEMASTIAVIKVIQLAAQSGLILGKGLIVLCS